MKSLAIRYVIVVSACLFLGYFAPHPLSQLAFFFGALGSALNLVVVATNGFFMPVSRSVALRLDLSGNRQEAGEGYVWVDEQTKLRHLADVIPVTVGPWGFLLSIGDVLNLVAVALLFAFAFGIL